MKAILDMGPDGIIFPFTNSAEIAEEAVRACSYPDEGGIRGQGPIRAIRYGLMNEAEYIQTAYSRVLKIMQIETLEGYENLEAIMEVEGIDSLFIGAADLGRSITGRSVRGRSGEKKYGLPEVYDDICRRVRAGGLTLGAAIGATKEEAANAMKKGIQWVVFGQDARVLAEGLKRNFDELAEF